MPDDTHSANDGIEPEIDGLTTAGVSRRSVLRKGASAVAGGSLLTASAGRGAATQDGGDRPLDVRTTDVEILGEESAETRGEVGGMERVDCERCRIGAQVARAGHDEWYGGLRRVVTGRTSFRVAVTLTGLRPGRYHFRLVACPVTHDHLCFGNSLTVVVRAGGRRKQKRDDHHGKQKEKKKKRGCPCDSDHPDRHHLTLCGGSGDRLRDYAFMVSGDDIEKSARSCAPSAVGHHAVTVDGEDRLRGDIVTGALAGGGDSFLFGGELTDMRCDDGVSVYLDGERLHY